MSKEPSDGGENDEMLAGMVSKKVICHDWWIKLLRDDIGIYLVNL